MAVKKHVVPASEQQRRERRHGDAPTGSADRSSAVASRPHPPGPPAAEDAEPLVQEGWAAIEDYDFDAAQAAFTEALTRSRGGSAAARGLLTLLVDHLAQDSEALALAPRLSSAARADAEVRVLLALAAARSGQADEAARLLAGLHHGRAAEVFLTLARGALAAGALAAATRHLESARAQDAGHADIVLVDEQIRKRRADERAPLEEEAALYLELGDHSEAERCAQAVLARWPESGAARHVLRVIQEARRAADARRLLGLADEAAAKGDLAAAQRWLEEALDTGVRGDLHATLQQRLDEISVARRAESESAQVAEIVGLLGAADPGPGLVAYAALRGPQRQAVREQVARAERLAEGESAALQHLRWLDELGGERLVGHEAAAAVAAVTALSAAMRQIDDPEAALATLAAHERLLSRLGAGRRAQREAQRVLLEQRQERARGLLREAEAALVAGDGAAAQALLGRSGWQALPASEQAAAEALQQRIHRAGEIGPLRDALARHEAAGDWLAARGVVEQLLARTDGEERERCDAERRRLQLLIDRTFALQRSTEPPASDDPDGQRELQDVELWSLVYLEDRGQVLLPGGQHLVWATAHGRWIFLRLLDCQTLAPVCRVLLRTPEPLALEVTEVDEQSVWLLGGHAGVLRLSLPDFEVLHYQARVEQVAEDEVVEDVLLTPDSRYLWFDVRPVTSRWGDGVVRIVDIERRRLVRELPGAIGIFPLARHEEPLMVVHRDGGDLAIHGTSGTNVARQEVPNVTFLYSVVMAPSGAGLVAAGVNEGFMPDPDAIAPLCLFALSAAGSLSAALPIPDSQGEGGFSLATARSSGLAFLRFRNTIDTIDLLAVRQEAGRFVTLYCVPAPHDLVLLQEPRARRVLGLWRGSGGLRSAELGAEPPVFEDIRAHSRLRVAALTHVDMCPGARGATHEEEFDLVHELQGLAPAARQRAVQAYQQRHADDPQRLIALVHALRQTIGAAGWRELAGWVRQRHPAHPAVRFLSAGLAADGERWEEVRELLAAVPEESWVELGGETAQHAAHLLAIAALKTGAYDEALRHLARGLAVDDGECYLSGLDLLCKPAEWTPVGDERGPLRRFLGVLGQVDAGLERGDLAGARRLLEQDFVWELNEVQTLARLAHVHLRCVDEGGAARFHKALVLASFCAAQAKEDRTELSFPGRWDAARIEQLAAEAQAWLDALAERGGSG